MYLSVTSFVQKMHCQDWVGITFAATSSAQYGSTPAARGRFVADGLSWRIYVSVLLAHLFKNQKWQAPGPIWCHIWLQPRNGTCREVEPVFFFLNGPMNLT
eukprot:TRINITY_DN58142_c0_g1_i1.p1 TRINITY_DN58142_c0_g1~~TRINITY_DN58142_c0_g1_i1.p1  ORF type:complete len:101 (-),score=8.34 TRINITY_DN58142_c0_g1_i1:61-363(-)